MNITSFHLLSRKYFPHLGTWNLELDILFLLKCCGVVGSFAAKFILLPMFNYLANSGS